MKDYESVLDQRMALVDGVGPWYWVREDQGAWNIISHEWEEFHKHNYFKHVKNFGIAVQAGGNCGMYPRLLAERFGCVYTFEPDPLNFLALALNCQQDNIIKLQAALGYDRLPVMVQRNDMINCGMHKVGGTGLIPQLRLDDLNLPACDFIGLDVELYEIHAIRGALNTIEKFRPVMAIENFNDEIFELLKPYNYRIDCVSRMDSILVPND
jgi:FkbM family methyltransferase